MPGPEPSYLDTLSLDQLGVNGPEVVVRYGFGVSMATHVLNALGTITATGEGLVPGRTGVSVAEVEVGFGEVHPVHVAASSELGQAVPVAAGCACGGEWVERARRSDGATFLGCSRFPACRATRSLD